MWERVARHLVCPSMLSKSHFMHLCRFRISINIQGFSLGTLISEVMHVFTRCIEPTSVYLDKVGRVVAHLCSTALDRCFDIFEWSSRWSCFDEQFTI